MANSTEAESDEKDMETKTDDTREMLEGYVVDIVPVSALFLRLN